MPDMKVPAITIKRDLMLGVLWRLQDMGFDVKGSVYAALPWYERRKDGQRDLACIALDDEYRFSPRSLVMIQRGSGGIYTFVYTAKVETFVRGFGPKPVTHVARQAAMKIRRLING